MNLQLCCANLLCHENWLHCTLRFVISWILGLVVPFQNLPLMHRSGIVKGDVSRRSLLTLGSFTYSRVVSFYFRGWFRIKGSLSPQGPCWRWDCPRLARGSHGRGTQRAREREKWSSARAEVRGSVRPPPPSAVSDTLAAALRHSHKPLCLALPSTRTLRCRSHPCTLIRSFLLALGESALSCPAPLLSAVITPFVFPCLPPPLHLRASSLLRATKTWSSALLLPCERLF
jgi:hypothetical protein